MELKRAGSQPSMKGPQEWFTGTVRIDPLNAPPPPARVSCAAVTFEPNARTAWHTHPLGQTLRTCAARRRSDALAMSSGLRLGKSTGMAPQLTHP